MICKGRLQLQSIYGFAEASYPNTHSVSGFSSWLTLGRIEAGSAPVPSPSPG